MRRRGRYITQAGDANQYRFRRAQWMKNAVPLEEVAANIDALVARDAAKRLEQLVAGQLLRRDRGGFALKPAVKPAARRYQGLLVGRNRIQEGSDIRVPPVCVAELPDHFRVGAQLACC